MKRKLSLLGAIFVISAFCVRAQIYEMYYQGFEDGEQTNYTVTPDGSATIVDSLAASGSNSIRLGHSTNDVTYETDVLDFTQNTSLSYITLEFDHICNITTWSGNIDVCKIYYKRENQTTWTQLTSTEYYQTSTTSTSFNAFNAFSKTSYNNWLRPTMINDYWRSERFDIETVFLNVAPQDRKLQFKFVVKGRTTGTGPSAKEAWWLDNIKVRASQNEMIDPIINMVIYPDGGNHPSSRGARVELDARTTVQQGINSDSVYLVYTVGSDPTPIKVILDPMGSVTGHDNITWRRFGTRIPFYGYDTVMRFYCVVKDSSSNSNTITYPAAANSWVEYRCVRGVAQPGIQKPGFTGTANYSNMPFPAYADNMSEWVFDSALMAAAGYGPGAITDLRFTVGLASNSAQTRPQFQFRMKNAPASYVAQKDGVNMPWTRSYMHVVYDNDLTFQPMAAGEEFTIHLDDTFYYAGGDLIMQTIYNGSEDPRAMSIKVINTIENKQTKEKSGLSAVFNDNPYNAASNEFVYADNQFYTKRPAIVMTQHANMPLVHDMGISRVVFPNYIDPIITQPSHLDVKLNNYGVATINAVRISYVIDDQPTAYFDWDGALQGGDSATVTINSNLTLPAGFHYVKVWVEDTLTSNGARYRDHEPYNDTSDVDFIVCAGPLSGTRTIGGSNGDYNTIEEFLFSLSRCGMDDTLAVVLAPGSYPAFTLPDFDGHTAEHYLIFRSADPNNKATIYADQNTEGDYIVDLDGRGDVRFRDLRFVRRSGMVTNMVSIAPNSKHIYFDGCEFIDSLASPSAAERIPAMLNSNLTDSLTITNNLFVGGNIGIDLNGQNANNLNRGTKIVGNTFRSQYISALSVQNQANVVIEDNEFYDVLTNQSYVVMMLECHDTVRFQRNKIYTGHGAGAIGANALQGTATNHVLIANNMIVCLDNGSSNQLTSPLSVISAEYTDIVYNSVKLTAPTRVNVAGVTLGGGVISNVRFMNNVVACLDNSNYAVHYMPGTQATNHVSNNVYYTRGGTINRVQGQACSTLDIWKEFVEEDTTSIVEEPGFLNGTLVDLRTYNRAIKGIATPIAQVNEDMFGNERDSVEPCPGAFEFVALFFDFATEEMLNPQPSVCGMPESVDLVLRLRNRGTHALPADTTTPLKIAYMVDNGDIDTIVVRELIPAEDTVTIHTGVNLHLPSNGILDATYRIKMWILFDADPNQTNDTSQFVVLSKYQTQAPDDIMQPVQYMSAATVNVTEGIDQWQVYGSDDAPKVPSKIYWYYNIDDAEPFHEGATLTTTTLNLDTTFYIKQHRELPMVRITQVMVRGANSVGMPTAAPTWLLSTTQVAVQLTNIGDDTAYLAGDTLRSISTASSANNKFIRFGDVKLAPGASIVVQYNSGTASESTLFTGSNTRITPAITSNLGFVYRHGGVAVDAIALNDITTASTTATVRWATQNVPEYVWDGEGIDVATAASAGLIRTAFNGNAQDWIEASAAHLLYLDQTNPSWIRYTDNGCQGGIGTVTLYISNPPTTDIDVTMAAELPEGCRLADEEVSVRLRNFGFDTIHSIELNYTLGGSDTVSETFAAELAPAGDTVYTFAQPVNLAFDTDSNVLLTVWATPRTDDPFHRNDTATTSTVSLFTSVTPIFADSISAPYGLPDTISIIPIANHVPVWYDYDLNPVDTGDVFITEPLFADGIIGVSYIVTQTDTARIGTGNSTNGKTSFPSPYQANRRFSKQQYIYTATELHNMGIGEGMISSIAFYLDTIQGNKDTLVYTNYSISFGTCAENTFTNKTAWKSVDEYYSRQDMTILRATQCKDWYWHQLDRQFYWDGVSNIVVQVNYALPASYNGGVQTVYTATPNTVLYQSNDTDTNLAVFTGNGTQNGNRPNIRFATEQFGCNGNIKVVKVGLIGIPDYDASIVWAAENDTTTYVSAHNASPKVRILNLGSNLIDSATLVYYIDNDSIADTTTVSLAVEAGEDTAVALFSRMLAPGRHTVKAIVSIEGDTIASNDTVFGSLMVRFSGGYYTIDNDSTNLFADFHSFAAAVDTLNAVGIVSPVIFTVNNGVYAEQAWLHDVYGLSSNRIEFRGEEDTIGAYIIGDNSNADNYVFHLSGCDNVSFWKLGFISRPTANNATCGNVLVLDSCNNVSIRNCLLRAKGSIYNANASVLVLNHGANRLVVTETDLDSGYYAIKTNTSTNPYENISITDNNITNFQCTGVDVTGVSVLNVNQNNIRTGATENARGMIGVHVSNADSTISIYRNSIYLVDERTGTKRGIHLDNAVGSNTNWALVANNMISCSGTGATGTNLSVKNPAGIYIDGNSAYINVLFNSVRVYAGETQNDTRAFYSGNNTENLQVMNNILANFSKSHAYYVTKKASIVSSDNNAYYTNGTTFAYYVAARTALNYLQAYNGMDENSIIEEPYFTSVNDLHLLMTNYCGKAQYNGNVMEDIDGKIRLPLPRPTIGAHEMDRMERNMTVLRIIEPRMPANKNNPYDIETDDVRVIATFYNNGSTQETNVSWYAYIEGHEEETKSAVRSLGVIDPATMRNDTVKIHTVIGMIDTHLVRVVLLCDEDNDTTDNTMAAPVYLAPAFDLEAVSVKAAASGCSLQNDDISITIKNVGFKTMPAGTTITIGYGAQAYYPSYNTSNPEANKLAIATMPADVSETYTLATDLVRNESRIINFTQQANLYPTDTALNIKVRITGYVNYAYDISTDNNHTGSSSQSSPIIDSWYTPRAPVGQTATFAYGTWGEVFASQENSLAIRWHRDTAATPFYAPSGNNAYANSCHWSTTPQYFHDSIYYLQCKSDKGCFSNFSTVEVKVSARVSNDLACEAVLAPKAGRVYMENDTVRVRIANYGTQSKSNFPITYQVRKGNGTAPLQQVTEICTANVPAGQTYTYTFDSLITFASATQGGTYQLRVWTDLSNDMVRRNDTLRMVQQMRPAAENNTLLDYSFTALAESTYPTRTNKKSEKVDIIRFSFNEIDIDMPALGRSYTNFGVFGNPEVPVLHVTRGMTDSVFMMITNPSDLNAIERGKVAIYIDFNRNGKFTDSGECVLPSTNLYNNTLLREAITISENASYGYMRMCVSAVTNDGNPTSTIDGEDGHMLNFLLFVDAQSPTSDLAITQIAEPRDYLIKDDAPRTISFFMANRGRQAVTSANIFYKFIHDDDEDDDEANEVLPWTGNLAPSASTLVSLPAHNFELGTTRVRIWVNQSGDVNRSNDTLEYEYHRFHTVVLTVNDDFDSLNYWYAPRGYNEYTRNYWECGIPSKTNINQAHSFPNAWVTDLNGKVSSGTRGNVSYLYSPIINISQIRTDTLSLYIAKNLLNNSTLHVEFYNFNNQWVKLECDTAPDNIWYNDDKDNVFTGTSGYQQMMFRTSYVSGDFQERLQFRLVYTTPQGTSASAQYGEGCAIDDFYIGRARRRVNVSVLEITGPDDPQYGQTIYPEILVKNDGYDTLRQVDLGYTTYGTLLAKVSSFECVLPPDSARVFRMTAPLVITSDFPDTFTIRAFSINSADIYRDMDTTERTYALRALDNDISAEEFLSPLPRVITGDSVTVVMRIRNFGYGEMHRAVLSYSLNGTPYATEEIDFDTLLGHPLESMQYFNHTFRRKFRATMGVMNIEGVAKSEQNDYIYNDTIHKRINGVSSITDLAAAAIILDTTSITSVRVELAIENRGARAANDFEVGFWVDDDSNNVHREIFHTSHSLAALATGYHLFQTTLPVRTAPYDRITAYVSALDDNDPSNDTTTLIVTQFTDLAADEILVEENARPECGVYMRIRNNGNMAIVGRTVTLTATINGNELSHNITNRLDPGAEMLVKFSRTVPKSSSRHYTGSGSVQLSGDSDPTNDQTNLVRVVNYVEGVPGVDAGAYVLGQNYPNPFSQQTNIPISLPDAAVVRFFVMDNMGHILFSTEGFYPSGESTIVVDMADYPAGVYFYGIETDYGRQLRKFILR